MREFIVKIAGRLTGINYNDLTTAERQIADLLIESNYLTKNDDGGMDHKEVYELIPTPNSEEATAFATLDPITQAKEIQRRRRDECKSFKDIAAVLSSGDSQVLQFRVFLLRLPIRDQDEIKNGTKTLAWAAKRVQNAKKT